MVSANRYELGQIEKECLNIWKLFSYTKHVPFIFAVFQPAQGAVDILEWTQRISLRHHQKVIESLEFKANFSGRIWLSFQQWFYLCNIPFPHITLRLGPSGILLKREFLSSTLSCSWTSLAGVVRTWWEETLEQLVLAVYIWKDMFSTATPCSLSTDTEEYYGCWTKGLIV